jgi:hypothetical protein
MRGSANAASTSAWCPTCMATVHASEDPRSGAHGTCLAARLPISPTRSRRSDWRRGKTAPASWTSSLLRRQRIDSSVSVWLPCSRATVAVESTARWPVPDQRCLPARLLRPARSRCTGTARACRWCEGWATAQRAEHDRVVECALGRVLVLHGVAVRCRAGGGACFLACLSTMCGAWEEDGGATPTRSKGSRGEEAGRSLTLLARRRQP